MMFTSIAVGQSNRDTPRSPVSISTDSSRRGSLRQVPREKHSEPSTPNSNSPRTRLARKRAASISTESTNEPRIEDLALSSARSSGPPTSDSKREQVCLCQPDPKIPRPRNAFILYRQHYQAQVVAQHPGLANPEISKIIGEQWREQAPEVKSDWKKLAEEEKQRHQRQYPNYRYQPRRAGRPNGIRPTSSSLTDDPIRCPKCHGRYITTPNTPLTPFTPAIGSEARSENHLAPYSDPHVTELERPSYPSQMQNTRMDTPHTVPHQQGHRRSQYVPPHLLSTHRERDEDMDLLSASPGQKRRRFNEDNQRGYAANSPISYSTPQPYRGAPPIAATGYRPQQLPGPVMLSRPGSMAPPPHHSPVNQQARHAYPTRSSAFDETLRLPPLQTQVGSASSSISHRSDVRMEAREIQARSIEAMVMTIPYINKIRVLSKISPPLQPPGPTSPTPDIRGAVVAVEGMDKFLLAEIGDFILEYLMKDPSFAIKTWSAAVTSKRPSTSQRTDTEMTDSAGSTSNARPEYEEKDPFVEYLSIITDWHSKSREMAKFVTSAPTASSSDHEASVSSPPPANQPNASQNLRTLPIALIQNGFSLTASDTFAVQIPINDSYAPIDHWQWMATLWRGIIGPDLTVYVTRVGREEIGKWGGVDVRPDCAAIIVRIQESGKMDEKTARRLGFEVVEFVRSVESGFGRP